MAPVADRSASPRRGVPQSSDMTNQPAVNANGGAMNRTRLGAGDKRDRVADLLRANKAADERVGTVLRRKRRSASSGVAPGKTSATNFFTLSVSVEPGSTVFTVAAVPLANSARLREIESCIVP